jgi:hypothetical protein
MGKPVGVSTGKDSTKHGAVTRCGGAEENGSGTGKAGLVLQGFSFAEQIGQRLLDHYLLDRFLIAHFLKGICIHQPPETQIVEKDEFLFYIHGQRSFEW